MPLPPQLLAALAAKLGGMPQGALQPGQPQPGGQIPSGGPPMRPNFPDQVPQGNPAPIDTSSPTMSAPGQAGAPTSPDGLLPQRRGDMYNPPFSGAEPTVEPNGPSPPVNNVGRTPLGALLIPPTLQMMMQRIKNG
jgi:hypothetical protein